MSNRRIAAAVVVAVLATMLHGVAPAQAASGTPILGPSDASQSDARMWAEANGAPSWYVDLAPRFWAIAGSRGVRPDVAYAQSAKETAFGRFGGVVDPSFQNPCGIKITAGGSNSDPNAHARFPNWDTGITACVDHLALYAGAPGYPRADSPDPRHFGFILGTAPTVEQLGGRWAPSPDYGSSIVNGYLTPMIVSFHCGFRDTPQWVHDAVCWLRAAGITVGTSPTTYSPNANVTRAQMAAFLWRAAGSPLPAGPSGFSDVRPGLFYSDAVAWLRAEGITVGTSPITYSPNANVTRAQLAAFLWRAAGSPPPPP